MNILKIATRKSPLALWQTEYVGNLIRTRHPDWQVEYVPLSTKGDEILDRSLAAIGGKGLFLKELELAILRGEADCAVHSLKDVPMELEAPLDLPAILPRAEVEDGFISNKYKALHELPHGARVGTSSLRRHAQLRARRPDLQILDLRGNVNTRLNKLDNGEYDAIILACAGLQRLGLGARIASVLAAPEWLPAPAQGAIVIEASHQNPLIYQLLQGLDDVITRQSVEAERAMNRALGGSCHVPVGAFTQVSPENPLLLQLHGLVGNTQTGELIRAYSQGDISSPELLGKQVAELLLNLGAGEFLALDFLYSGTFLSTESFPNSEQLPND